MITSTEPIGLVIFDCDGVLVDTERIAARVNVALGAELGWPLTEEEAIRLFIGRSSASNRETVAGRLGAEAAREWEERFARMHAEAVDAGLTPVDGLPEALDAITLPACVASSGTHEKMRHTLGRTGLYERFAGRIHSATEVARGKPAPDLFLYAARRMGVAPSACAVVEDSRPGVEAARAAGMRSFGYAGGLTPAAHLAGPGTVLFTDMRDLPDLLAGAGAAPGADGGR
ncbi:HAD family hydrolase [Streptomyces sp. NRRL S-244]|uniref:HAD family hydrolase n=1 Tax=Streptomyces sp. NRRL S-244 TaxID=1463897 RepID=UPI0004C2144A|nr:HAD family hydrolase [Streptomyces sp. NRRL S-244]